MENDSSRKITIEQQIRYQLIDLTYKHRRYGQYAELLVFSLIAWELSHLGVNSLYTQIWYILAVILWVGRYLEIIYHRKKFTIFNQNEKKWLILLCASVLSAGISWAPIGSILLPEQNLYTHPLTVQILIINAAMSIACIIYAPIKHVYLLFLLPAYIPHLFWLWYANISFGLLIIMAPLYCIFLIILSYYINKFVTSSSNLKLENIEVSSDLYHAKLELIKDLQKIQLLYNQFKMEHKCLQVLLSPQMDEINALKKVIQIISEQFHWKLGVFWRIDADNKIIIREAFWAENEEILSVYLKHIPQDKTDLETHHFLSKMSHSMKPEWFDVSQSYVAGYSSMFETLSIKWVFGFPVIVDNKVIAFLDFFSTLPISLNQDEYNSFLSVSYQLGLFLKQQVAHQKEQEYQVILQTTLEATTDGIMAVNKEDRIQFFNQKLIEVLDIPREIIETGDELAVRQAVVEKLENPGEFIETTKNYSYPNNPVRLEFNYKDGRVIESFVLPQRMGQKLIGRVISLHDITQRKKLEAELFKKATHDPLTALPNRVVLFDRIQQAINHAKRWERMVAVLFLDVDHFKLINDRFGHDVGDEVIKHIADVLQNSLRAKDTISRMGGDEFVIVLSDLDKFEEITIVCQKILQKVSEPFNSKDRYFTLSASIGVSVYPKDGEEINGLIKYADIANQSAKNLGRNTFHFFSSELSEKVSKRVLLEQNLRQALSKHEFLLDYQPFVELKTNKIVGVEALLRWNHPKLGLIPPQEFIPLADEIGIMLPIGYWILDNVCHQNSNWQALGLKSIRMSINLTLHQMSPPNFVDIIVNTLNKYQLSAETLEFEIPETSILEGAERTLAIIQNLKRLGAKIVISGFGKGFSNLSYLNKLSIDKIEIDRSFTNFISENPSDVSVILVIIAMAKQLGIRTIASGVETQAQFQFLQRHGCDEVQGYFLYRPVPSENITKILMERNSLS